MKQKRRQNGVNKTTIRSQSHYFGITQTTRLKMGNDTQAAFSTAKLIVNHVIFLEQRSIRDWSNRLTLDNSPTSGTELFR